jgi:hypothetical protein
MSELEMTGIWWLASNPSDQLGGTLTFDESNGTILSLIGSFGGLRAFLQIDEIGTVYGVADNKFVTLHNAFTKTLNTKAPGPDSQIIGANRVFVGNHLEDKDLHFNRVDIGLEYLAEFINHTSLKSILEEGAPGKWAGVKAEVATQGPISLGDIKGGHASIRFGWGQSGDRFRTITLRESCTLTLEFNKSIEIDEILTNYVRPLQDFVTMATDRPNAITDLSFRGTHLLDDQPKPMQQKIELFQRSIIVPSRKKKSTLMSHDMLFLLSDLDGVQIRRWLSITKRYRPVVGILFGQRYSRDGLHIENQLLNAVSAVEAYHRRRFTNTILDKAAWKKQKKAITSKADPSDLGLLNQVLQFANEKRLKERLDEILAHSGPVGRDLIPDADLWSKQVREYRNALTHYDPDSPHEIEDYEMLYWLAKSLSWLMLACIMIETGFKKRKVIQLFRDNQRYLFDHRKIVNSLESVKT